MAVNLEKRVDGLEKLVGQFVSQMIDFKNEMSDFKNEMRSEVVRMNYQWGNLASRLGTLTECVVLPRLDRIIKEQFGVTPEATMRRVQCRKNEWEAQFDVMAKAKERLFLNRTESTLRSEDIRAFVKDIESFRNFSPEYRDKKIVGILATLNLDPRLVKNAEKYGFLVLGVGHEIMEVKNRAGFKAKEW